MIYFVQGVGGGPIKIGYTVSTSPTARLAGLQTGSPVPLRVLRFERGTVRDENAMHRRFAALRMHGEWFYPGPELLAYLSGRGSDRGAVSIPRRRLPPGRALPRCRRIYEVLTTDRGRWFAAAEIRRAGADLPSLSVDLVALHRLGWIERRRVTDDIGNPSLEWRCP